MDKKSINEHVRLWQQVLMFFAQTQRGHLWKSPKYQFTQLQREAWEALVEAAERSAGPEEEEEEVEEEAEDEEMDDAEMQDDVDKAIKEMETDEQNTTANAIRKP
jgi:hypothetical protein